MIILVHPLFWITTPNKCFVFLLYCFPSNILLLHMDLICLIFTLIIIKVIIIIVFSILIRFIMKGKERLWIFQKFFVYGKIFVSWVCWINFHVSTIFRQTISITGFSLIFPSFFKKWWLKNFSFWLNALSRYFLSISQ